MKEVKLESIYKNKTEISIQKKVKIEKEFISKIIPHSGHQVYEINNETLEISLANYEVKTFIIAQSHNNKEIIIREGFSYVSALNIKNALKKFNKGSNGSKDLSGGIEINPFKTKMYSSYGSKN